MQLGGRIYCTIKSQTETKPEGGCKAMGVNSSCVLSTDSRRQFPRQSQPWQTTEATADLPRMSASGGLKPGPLGFYVNVSPAD